MPNLFMRFPGGKSKTVTLSYDDGVEQDIRLIEIMQKHGLKGTFNINSGGYAAEGTVFPPGKVSRRMTFKQAQELYLDSGMEVAVHALTHPFLEQLPVECCTYEVMKDRENLEEQYGTLIRGMAYPYGTFSDQVVESLRCCGIAYARTTISSHRFKMPKDWLRLEATCHHRDEKLMELAEEFVNAPGNKAPLMFYLWGHSYEFEGADNWNVIEEFAEYMGGRQDIWYATNIEIYDYEEAFKRLKFSVNSKRVYNPTLYEIYFNYNWKDYSIKPGETLVLE